MTKIYVTKRVNNVLRVYDIIDVKHNILWERDPMYDVYDSLAGTEVGIHWDALKEWIPNE